MGNEIQVINIKHKLDLEISSDYVLLPLDEKGAYLAQDKNDDKHDLIIKVEDEIYG